MTSLRTVLATTAIALMAVVPEPSFAQANARGDMIRIPGGHYEPLYGSARSERVAVSAFRLDRDPVTRGEYLAFVQSHEEWTRSQVAPVKANRASYLADWTTDDDPGRALPLDAPITNVSWFAARAYCDAHDKRLPTIAEWEYVAASSARVRDAARSPEFIQDVVSLYLSRARVLPSVETGGRNYYGVRGMHSLVSEWVEDFNSVLVSDDSRGVGGRDHDFFCASAAIGALDPTNYPAFLRYALRSGLSGRTTMQSLGFRCAA